VIEGSTMDFTTIKIEAWAHAAHALLP